MNVAALRWTRYAVPFTSAFATARASWRVREGLVLRVVTGDGVEGIGEAAPLPYVGVAQAAECADALEAIAPRLAGAPLGGLLRTFDAAAGDGVRFAALRCAVETAALDASARAAGVSIAQLLCGRPAESVRVNAVVDAATCAQAAEAAARAVRSGFRDIKLKTGTAGSPQAEAARVAAVRAAAGPDVRLRVDANGAWPEADAIATLRALEPYAIELAEQPVPPGDLQALRRVRHAVRVPVAADESVTGVEAARALLAAGAVDALVVKPQAVGGPRRAIEIARLAAGAGAGAIVTSAFDAGIGVAAALQAAAALPDARYACGLATLGLLEDDLVVEPPIIDAGEMGVPPAPGLGVVLDEAALARYATAPERTVRA